MRVICLAGVSLLMASSTSWSQGAADSTGSAIAKLEEAPPDAAAAIAKLEASVPSAKEADVHSIDAIMVAIYDVISGPAGNRDWNRFRSLMLPNARLTSSIVDEHGKHAVQQWSVEEFITETQSVFTTQPFYEAGLVNRVQRFGNIAQVFTSYASRSERTAEPFQRGINSMQLMYDGTRWWVVSILWDVERPGNALPKAMRR
jgi:hypothetical protein